MIKVDIATAVALYLSVYVVGLLGLWIFLEERSKFRGFTSDRKYVWHCSICGYIYIDSKHEKLSVCPRCSSYNEKKSTAQGAPKEPESGKNGFHEGVEKGGG